MVTANLSSYLRVEASFVARASSWAWSDRPAATTWEVASRIACDTRWGGSAGCAARGCGVGLDGMDIASASVSG